MKFTPRDNWVLLRVHESEQNTSRVLLPTGVSAISGVIGEVISKGPGAVYDDGKRTSIAIDDIEPGMRVFVSITLKSLSDIPYVGDKKNKLWLVAGEEIASIMDMDSKYEWEEEPQTPVVLEA
jgi:co-chaperonin GroES (HSP10)